jgi:hypothetical protein
MFTIMSGKTTANQNTTKRWDDNHHMCSRSIKLYILQIEPDTNLNPISLHPRKSLYLASNQNVAGEIQISHNDNSNLIIAVMIV